MHQQSFEVKRTSKKLTPKKTFHSTTSVNCIDLSFCSCTHLSQTEALTGKLTKCYEAGLYIVCR